MATPSLTNLPAELLAEIACNMNVYEVLCFTATCHTIREACLDPLLFKALIEYQHTTFDFHSQNMERISARMCQDASVLARYKHFEMHNDPRHVSRWGKAAAAETLQQHFGLDQQIWFRYAVADYRIHQLCDQLSHVASSSSPAAAGAMQAKGQIRPSLKDSMQYLPHLLLLKHPSIHSTGLAAALMAQISLASKPLHVNGFDLKQGLILPSHSPRIAFSYCATMLSQDTPEAAWLDASNPRAALTKFFVDRVSDTICKLRVTRDLNKDITELTISQSDAQILIGAFSAILRRAFREYRVRRLIGSDYYTFVLPYILDIPIALDESAADDDNNDDGTLPVPFPDSFKSLRRRRRSSSDHTNAATLAWEDWQRTYVAQLSQPASLTAGRWVGCYSEVALPPARAAPEVDAPMRDIDFTVSAEGSVTATGRDALGHFTLRGRLGAGADASTEPGALILRKTYRNATLSPLVWHARMTPFGIAGLWGPPMAAGDVPSFRGSFWLWKEEWTMAG